MVTLSEIVEKALRPIYTNKGKTAIAAGIAGAAAKYYELGLWMGQDYEIAGRHFTMTEEWQLYLSGTRLLMWPIITYVFLMPLEHYGGLANCARTARASLTRDPKKRLKLLEKIWESQKVSSNAFERSCLYLDEGRIESSIEALREANSLFVAEHYSGRLGQPVQKNLFERQIFKHTAQEQTKQVAGCIKRIAGMKNDTEASEALPKIQLYATQLEAYMAVLSGNVAEADKILSEVCEIEPKELNSMVYGSFLDSFARLSEDYLDKSNKQWEKIISDLLRENPQFQKLPGSKNEVLLFKDSEIKQNMLIIKRSSEREDIEREYKVTQLLYELLGHKGLVPEAVSFREHDGSYYLIQKRILGENAAKQLSTHPEEVIGKLLHALDEYQRMVQRHRRLLGECGVDTNPVDLMKSFTLRFSRRIDDVPIAPIERIVDILNKQRNGGCHGDLHENNIIYDGKQVCIIDSEHLHYGPRILDFADLIVHSKVQSGIDLSRFKQVGMEFFKERMMSKTDYAVALESAILYKSSVRAGIIRKYAGDDPGLNRFVKSYITEAMQSAERLKELTGNKEFIDLSEAYSRIRLKLPA